MSYSKCPVEDPIRLKWKEKTLSTRSMDTYGYVIDSSSNCTIGVNENQTQFHTEN